MGIFDNEIRLYRTFEAQLQFRTWLVGGQPKTAKSLREMLLRKAGTDAVAMLQRDLLRLAEDLEIENPSDMSLEELEKVVDAKSKASGNGFHCDQQGGLYIQAYQVKAAFRESCNIAFAGDRWGKTSKGAKSYLAERLFVNPERIYLGRDEPDGVYVKTGVVTGKGGKRSIMSQAEYVDRPQITFAVSIDKEAPELFKAIPELWVRMQDLGIGAMRSSGFGTFDLTAWTEKTAVRKAA